MSSLLIGNGWFTYKLNAWLITVDKTEIKRTEPIKMPFNDVIREIDIRQRRQRKNANKMRYDE